MTEEVDSSGYLMSSEDLVIKVVMWNDAVEVGKCEIYEKMIYFIQREWAGNIRCKHCLAINFSLVISVSFKKHPKKSNT